MSNNKETVLHNSESLHASMIIINKIAYRIGKKIFANHTDKCLEYGIYNNLYKLSDTNT